MTTELNIADELELYMLGLINEARAEHNLAALVMEQHLNDAAEDHSVDMIQEDFFAHDAPDGESAHDRIVAAGFDLAGQWWTGENLSISTANGESYYDEIDVMFEGLMNSTGHRANILSENYTYVGIGIEVGMFDFDDAGLSHVLSGNHFSILATQNFGATSGDVLLDPSEIDAPPPPEDITFRGGDEDDVIEGGAGNDNLMGGDGNDMIYGGDGINRLVGNRGEDQIWGGDDRDVIIGGGQQDTIYGNDGNDAIKGHRNADEIYGGGGNDVIRGNKGGDTIDGGSGDDVIDAGGQNDILIGGSGDDTLNGGNGSDTFIFSGDHDNDIIEDFDVGADTLQIGTDIMINATTGEEFIEFYTIVTGDGVMIETGGGSILLEGLDTTAGLTVEVEQVF